MKQLAQGSECPDCGAPFEDRAACDRAFHELGARAAGDVRFGYRRRAVVDAYCLQHPAYVESLKSFAAHLCGLCAAVERQDDARAERTIWSDLRIPPDAVKPSLASRRSPLDGRRSTLTVALPHAAVTPAEFQRAVDAWINDVWAAWSDQHNLARRWLDFSIAQPRRRHEE